MDEQTLMKFYGLMTEAAIHRGNSASSMRSRQQLVDQVLELPWSEQPRLLARLLGGWEACGELTLPQLETMYDVVRAQIRGS